MFFILPVFLLGVITGLVYSFGLPGDFEFDDGVNIVQNKSIQIESLSFSNLYNAAMSSGSGPLRRPVAMLSFAFNYYFFQQSVVSYKIINIGIHIANSYLVFMFCFLVFRRIVSASEDSNRLYWVALAVALSWALAPINLTSVLYVIQRMVSLGAFFGLLALLCWFHGRSIVEKTGSISMLWVSLFLLSFSLAILCKETYVLLGVVICLLEWVIFTRGNPKERLISWIMILMLSACFLVFITVLLQNPQAIIGDYNQRNFTLYERLISQSRVVVFYLQMIVFPSNIQLGLYHDDFVISGGLLDPVTTLLSVLFICSLVLGAFFSFKRSPQISLGILWFFCWHLLESTFISLELIHEHRNYLASLGMLWAIYFVVQKIGDRLQSQYLVQIVFGAFILLNTATTALRAHEWSDLTDHALAEVIHHPDSVRAKYQLGRIHMRIGYREGDSEHLELALRSFKEAADLSDYDLLPLFGVIRVKMMLGEEIKVPVAHLAEKLKLDIVPVTTIVALSEFLNCMKAGECEPLKEHYTDLIDAALLNEQLNQRSLSDAFGLKASFYAEVIGDEEKAFGTLKQSLKRFPMNYTLRKGMIYYLFLNGRLAEAVTELQQFRNDFWHRANARAVYYEICNSIIEMGKSVRCE